MAKSKVRPKLDIPVQRRHLTLEPYPMCEGMACRNVVALWVKPHICSRCRKEMRGDVH